MLDPVAFTVSSLKPRLLTLRRAPGLTLSLKAPFTSVMVAFWVPTSLTVAPMTGSPLVSTTVPLTVFLSCCTARALLPFRLLLSPAVALSGARVNIEAANR